MKRAMKWLTPILLIIGAAYYWLLVDNRPGAAMAKIDIAALRSAANSIAGDKPDAITVETVSRDIDGCWWWLGPPRNCDAQLSRWRG
jgi:hypothetical protein